MNILRRAGVAGVGLLLGVSLQFLGGCGYKDHPVPPAAVVPEAIEDLRYDADAKGITLSWSYPMETIKGKEIEDLASFELYRAEVPLKDYCGNCPIPFAEPLEQPGGVTTEDGKRRRAVYTMTDLRPGYKYFFKVRSRTSWFAESADSNIVTFVWQVPAKAPEGLKAEVGNKEIVLSWQPVTSLQDGGPVDKPLQYQVLRSTSGKDFEKIGLVDRGTSFVDPKVAKNQQYAYQVQTLMKVGEETVSGGTSRPVTALSVDQTAPCSAHRCHGNRNGYGDQGLLGKVQRGGYRRLSNLSSYRRSERSCADRRCAAGIHPICRSEGGAGSPIFLFGDRI